MENKTNHFSRIGKWIIRNIWLILLDIIAVNAAYYLALLIRFYVNYTFHAGAIGHLEDFFHFAPWYTIACIIVFIIFRLYNGIWKYAGTNDMHRILGANAVTCLIQIFGTLLFVHKMPKTYYAIGAVLQVCFIILIRFAYRIFVVERCRMRSRQQTVINVLVAGAGETGRRVMKYLSETTTYRVACILDLSGTAGHQSMDGIPVIDNTSQLTDTISRYDIRAIFLAHPMIPGGLRKWLQDFCREHDLDMQDYTGFLANLGGNISLTTLLELSHGPLILKMDGQEKAYQSSEDAIKDISEQYQVKRVYAVDGQMIIELKRYQPHTNSGNEGWIQEYQKETGEEISFF